MYKVYIFVYMYSSSFGDCQPGWHVVATADQPKWYESIALVKDVTELQ